MVNEETREKKRKSMIGKNLGKRHSEATKKILSEKRVGKTPWNKGLTMEDPRVRRNYESRSVKLSFKGKTHTSETKTKIASSHRGAKSHFWKGGASYLNHWIRSLSKYRQWRSDVFERDDFTCQACNQRGGKLNADHIKPLSVILAENKVVSVDMAIDCEEIWNLNNGRTLCYECHKNTDTYAKNLRGKEYND